MVVRIITAAEVDLLSQLFALGPSRVTELYGHAPPRWVARAVAQTLAAGLARVVDAGGTLEITPAGLRLARPGVPLCDLEEMAAAAGRKY